MDEDKLQKIMVYLENLNQRLSKIEGDLSKQKNFLQKNENILISVKEESFREFFLKFNPQKDTDKTLIIIYFLESVKKTENITTKEIASGFSEVRETLPDNIADKIQMLHKRGFIMPKNILGRLRSWEVTTTGLKYLEELENGNKKN